VIFRKYILRHCGPPKKEPRWWRQPFERILKNSCRFTADACALKLADFATLPVYLRAHPLDFGSELVKLMGFSFSQCLFDFAPYSGRLAAFSFQKPQAVP
jgi:hypothetical protein